MKQPASPRDKIRLDVLLHDLGLAVSRETARRLIMAGEVTVASQLVTKPGALVSRRAKIGLKQKPRFASRGGDKLAAALEFFGLHPDGWICADVGASTGGFTDCLLKSGAARVYAIDVGYGQLDWPIRQNRRVVVMERTNARYLEGLPEQMDFVTIDVSFISLKLILPVARKWLRDTGQVVALVKPQFEAGRGLVGKGGVVREPAIHRQVLIDVFGFASASGFGVRGLIPSPLRGPAGNCEFLIWLTVSAGEDAGDLGQMLDDALVASQPSDSGGRSAVEVW